jgi:adenylate cyclase class 2
MAHGTHETEIKLAVSNVQEARRRLRAAGFRVARRRVFESNTVYENPGDTIMKEGKLLRVRQAGGVGKLTYKGPAIPSRHKSREELEVEVSDGRTTGVILERLGFHPAFRYEKYRAEYRQPGKRGVATVDETPVGVYLELEGTSPWIDRIAHKLGFTEADYITASYGRLYVDWCRRHGVEPSNMVFAK